MAYPYVESGHYGTKLSQRSLEFLCTALAERTAGKSVPELIDHIHLLQQRHSLPFSESEVPGVILQLQQREHAGLIHLIPSSRSTSELRQFFDQELQSGAISLVIRLALEQALIDRDHQELAKDEDVRRFLGEPSRTRTSQPTQPFAPKLGRLGHAPLK
ncbi:MAG TPA: hypothetical protein VFG51_02925 [Candidatus Saccharimonadia bacterium]|nr:hypothetical protein [Candidatus Saccharimonadia bacterium]